MYSIACRIDQATASHFQVTNILIGFNVIETSTELPAAIMYGVCDNGYNIIIIRLVSRENVLDVD